MLADYARKVAASLQPGTWCWYYAYGNLFLAEYVLATGDRSILPELRRTTMEAVKAQCMNGMWGHCAALPDGHSEGYGGMNQIGLPMTIALVLARQAGVHDPALDRAIERSIRLLRWYVNKGAIPYGDHQPWPGHEDNGKCSSGAVLFDLLGDREAARSSPACPRRATTSGNAGTRGNFFNMLWALPGVSRCGPLATGAYLKEQAWYYDLARDWDGGFVYQKFAWGEEEHGKYTDWDLHGSVSAGLRAAAEEPLCDRQETVLGSASEPPRRSKEVIAAGRDFYPVNGKNGYRADARPTVAGRPVELVAGGAEAFGAGTGPARGRFRAGAAEAAGRFRPRRPLRRLRSDWLSGFARRCGCATTASPAQGSGPVDGKSGVHASCGPQSAGPQGQRKRFAGAGGAQESGRSAGDDAALALPLRCLNRIPGREQPTILNHSLEGVDRQLLYPAMGSLLQNDDSVARGCVAPT